MKEDDCLCFLAFPLLAWAFIGFMIWVDYQPKKYNFKQNLMAYVLFGPMVWIVSIVGFLLVRIIDFMRTLHKRLGDEE
jgi:hypothetical protein